MNGLVETVTKGSASFRKLNAHLIAWPSTPPRNVHAPTIGQEPAKKRIRQKSGDGMNKWERDFRAEYLEPRFASIHREVSLPLANGLRYKVDFLCCHTSGSPKGYEVKGVARAAGIAKLKMAATLYPWIAFRLVTKRKGGGWDIEEVRP